MSIKKVKKEFKAWLKEGEWPYHEDSCIHVNKESKNFYHGIHSNMGGSFSVKFLKSKCTKTDPMKKQQKTIEAFLKTPEGKKRLKKI